LRRLTNPERRESCPVTGDQAQAAPRLKPRASSLAHVLLPPLLVLRAKLARRIARGEVVVLEWDLSIRATMSHE